MEHYAAIDVSLELSSVCVVDGTGKIVLEAKVGSEPDVIVAFFRGLAPRSSELVSKQDLYRAGCMLV